MPDQITEKTVREALTAAEVALAEGFANCDEDPECVFAEPLIKVRAALATMGVENECPECGHDHSEGNAGSCPVDSCECEVGK